MRVILRNIVRKSVTAIAILAIVMLNFSAVIQCRQMLLNDGCCHTSNSVKPCCVKNLKITTDERVTGHCGCSFKQSQQPVDMFIDLSSNQHKNYSNSNATDIEFSYTNQFSPQNDIHAANYSPPIITYDDVYLTNLNLRI